MKSKCSFILKASTALVLALLMLFGTVATSLAAVVDNTDTGAEADLAETGYNTSGTVRLYYDNSVTNWSNVYFRIGHTTYNQAIQMSPVVAGSKLYTCTVSGWNGYVAFNFANNYGWTGDNNSIYENHIYTAATVYKKFALSGTYYFKGTDATDGSAGNAHYGACVGASGNGTDGDTTASNYTTYSKTVTRSAVTNGNVKVDYINTSRTATTIANGNTSTNATALIGTDITVTVTPSSGYYTKSISATNTSTASASNTNTLTTTLTGNSTTTVSTVIDLPGYYLLGLKNDYDWDADADNKMTYNSTTGLYEITRNLYSGATTYGGTSASSPDDTGFKVFYSGDDSYYGRNSTCLTTSSTSTTLNNTGNNVRLTTKDLSSSTTSKVPYKFTFNASTKELNVYYPMKVTYNMQSHGTNPSSNGYVVAYGSTITAPTAPTATGYTFGGWFKEAACTNAWNFTTDTVTADTVLYAKWTAKTSALTFNLNGGSGTAQTGLTATYGSAMPSYTNAKPTKDGYTFAGFYDAASGGTQYYTSALASTRNWNKNVTTGTTLYAQWTEVKAGATVKAYTDGSASSTGGTVKVGTGTAGATATISNSTFGIETASPAIIRATTASGYTFEGWETGGTYGSHVKLYIDSACTTLYNKATHGGTYSTVYAKTDGYSANAMTTGNTEIHALFESAKYTITNSGAYHKTGSADYVSGNTGGTFTVSSTGSLAYNTNLTLTATAASGYAVEGIYWSTDGTSWTKVTTSDTKTNGVITTSTNNTFKVINNYRLKANFVQVLKLSAFDSYEKNNNQVTFVTAPPKSITIKHTDAHGTATTYTYSFDGTKAAGNPESPDGTKPAALPIASGKYGQGNYIQYYAGDEITLTYSAMASSEILKGVFYDNTKNFFVNKPAPDEFFAHNHPTTPAIYMNSAYYTTGELNGRTFTGVTADNDAHSIKFTGTQDYKNIDVEIGTKRKVYFSDYTNTVITSKNVDDYYYDNEPLSVTGDQLKVAAKQSATQTNSIDATKVRYYKANADGTKGTELTAAEKTALMLTIVGSTSTSSASADGAALIFDGNMPAYDLYIDLNMENSYTIKLGTKIVSDLGGTATRLASKATVKINTLSAVSNADVTTSSTSVTTGTTATLSVTGLTSGYMFVGWYWGDASGPDYNKGFISDKQSLSYAPKKGGIIWAVGTKELFINGSKYITGKSTDWYSENNTWKNQQMSFDPDRGTQGSYYWEITDTMFASAGNDFKYISSNSGDTGGSNTEGKYFKGDDNYYYWCNNEDSKHGKAFFQLLDTATGYGSREVWKSVYSFLENADGTTHGKILKRDMNQAGDTDYQRLEGQGFIDFAESRYSGYSSPLRIYLDAATKDLDVVATAIHSNLYVSNGYDVGSTLKTDAVTVQPVVDGVVKTSGQTGYFAINTQGSGWNPDAEGHVSHYIPQKKGATVRITKQAGGSDKIAAFLIYDIDNRTVRAERNLTKGTTANSKTPYYFDLTLANERQNLYIVPIVEEAGAKVTITFDATQLNRAQWGDIVTAYTWYTGTNNNGLGAYPGQPMIPSDDMSTWTTTFAATKGGNELTGITFTNYVDGIHSWLGCSGVMGEVSDHTTGAATGGIINVYNHVDSGTNGEYSRTNYKAQTYDYHEPIALYNRYKNEDSVNITFQMKDGNSSLISWRHTEFAPENIISGTWGHTLNWEYLTNAKGDQYIDMNGNPLGANNKPTATFYVASKGQVVYNDSRMDYVFHGGHNYQMKGYDAAYSDPTGGADRGSYTRTALPSGQWSSDITYGGAADLDMKYAVQWYVYDAQGNYITTVLSAGIADLSSNNTDTYIAKQLEDLGYAVDGKSVAICYDKPRYMYGDWTVTNSAQNINSGPNFDAYRFEGQWIAAAQTDTVKVHVGVGMMTDSGEVLADSNTAAYGNASASLVSGVNFGKPNYAITANDGSWAQTAASDAKLNGIALNASATNFIGWYYYDANTGEFTKATYASNEGFRPNYTNKDVTYYAIYRAAAVYNYIYQGREGERIYSAAGEDLKDAEMVDNKVIYANHSEDILSKLPVGIGIFKKNIDFSAANANSWTKNNDTQYILKLSGFEVTNPEYTLTAYYKDASGQLQTTTKTSVYNGGAVNLTTLNGGTAVTTLYGKKFLGWYAYDNGEKGDLLSTQANYGLQLTRDQAVIAVYDEDNNTLPTDGWSVHIDENEVNKELTTKDTGVFYNDTIVRVRKSSDVKAELPTGAKIGVLVVCDNKTGNAINGYSDGNLNTLVKAVASGKTMKTSSGLSITNMQASSQTSFNRTDIAVRADYAKNLGAKYCVYAYFFDGSAYHFSAVSDVKTYV